MHDDQNMTKGSRNPKQCVTFPMLSWEGVGAGIHANTIVVKKADLPTGKPDIFACGENISGSLPPLCFNIVETFSFGCVQLFSTQF